MISTPVTHARRQQPPSAPPSDAAAARSEASSASRRSGWAVTRTPATEDPLASRAASLTTNGPYAGAVTEPSL